MRVCTPSCPHTNARTHTHTRAVSPGEIKLELKKEAQAQIQKERQAVKDLIKGRELDDSAGLPNYEAIQTRYVLYPDVPWRYCWDGFMMLLVVYYGYMIPITMSFWSIEAPPIEKVSAVLLAGSLASGMASCYVLHKVCCSGARPDIQRVLPRRYRHRYASVSTHTGAHVPACGAPTDV